MKSKKAYPYNLIDDLMEGEDFHTELDDNEVLLQVESIIQSLSDNYTRNKHIPKRMQAILRYYYVDEMTYKEIGDIYNISAGRVGDIKRRALRLLRNPLRLHRLILKGSD